MLADFIGASSTEFVFTSGGTESNNIALLGLLRNLRQGPKHIVTTALEHPSVLEPCRRLQNQGIEVTYVPRFEDIESALRPETVLVSAMHANNETGALNSIRDLSSLLRGRGIYLHSDGVQALGKIPVDVANLGVDMYSFSAHKVYAPKGIGGLYVRRGVPLRGIQFGGRHERERRAGTENVPGAVAFEAAVRGLTPLASDLRDTFERRISESIENVRINGASGPRIPNTSNIYFPGVSGEAMVIALDTMGIAVSSGSACSSGSTEPSHVLTGMGFSREYAKSCVRFSFGATNTREDVDRLIEAVAQCAARLRKHGAKHV